MNLFATPMLSADPSRVTTCEKVGSGGWNRGLKMLPHGSPSAETRAKLSAALKGRPTGPKSAQHLAKIGAANKGKIRSAEHRAKTIAALRGRTLSDEHRAKLSAAKKGKIRSAEHQAKIAAALRGRSVKGEIMTPWGKYHSVTMAKDCGTMLGVTQTGVKMKQGLRTDPENYYYIKAAK